MADNRRYNQAQKFTLAVGISTTDTSITLQSFNFPDGTAIASGDLGTINYGTLEPGTSREESISFTGITSNADGTVTLTGVTRGLGFGAVDTYSEQSDLRVQHGTGAIFILSNTAAFYNDFVNKFNDETIEGTLSVPVPTSSTHAATKQYVDDNVNGGAVSNDRIVQAGTAGESVAAGDLVYFDDTDNEWKKTDATDATTLDNVLLGIAQGSGSDGGAISGGVLTYGLDSTQTGLTVGVKLYAGDTAGAIVESAGTVERVIGWSKSATEIYFDANVDTLPTADEKTFLTNIEQGSLTPQVVTFTSSGTWTKDAGLKYIVVEVQGAGAHGSDNSYGGGAGAYSKKLILASALGATETVTVGTANIGSGNTSFGSLLLAPNAVAEVGGTASGGDLNIDGQDGTRRSDASTSDGGNSFLGFGGRGGEIDLGTSQASNGYDATGYGAGGGGNTENGDSSAPGDGTPGIVIVTEYYV